MKSIRSQYEEFGTIEFYKQHGARYRNPHEPHIHAALLEAHVRWQLPLHRVLDLCCGSGEVTEALQAFGADAVVGCDPFTYEAYYERTKKIALRFSFADIAQGALHTQGQYSLIVCSYALHLVGKSWLPAICKRLGEQTNQLLILTPHKRPELKDEWGWKLEEEFVLEGVRARYYAAT